MLKGAGSTSEVERLSYEQILQQLGDLDSWLAGTGYSRAADRFRIHSSSIRKLIAARSQGKLHQFIQHSDISEIVWSLVEGTELAEIWGALRSKDPTILREKLHDALDGPPNPLRESDSSSHGRNTIFELSVAARLVRRGFKVEIRAAADILCEVDGMNLYIECKRPFRETGITKGISKARKQIVRDLDSDATGNCRGIIAISMSHAVNPKGRILVASTPLRSSVRLADELQQMASRYTRSWADFDPSTIAGLVFDMVAPTFLEQESLLTMAQQAVVFPLGKPGQPEMRVLQALGT